jgi:acid phosphatase class B
MKPIFENARTTVTIASMICLALAGQAGAQTADATVVEVRGGTAVFAVETNISGISVHGKSNALTTSDDVKLSFDLTAKQTGPRAVGTTGGAR